MVPAEDLVLVNPDAVTPSLRGNGGSPLSGVMMTVLAMLLALPLMPRASGAGESSDDIIIGQRVQLYSEVLGETRTLEIYLPDNYEDSQESYPVLVILDGGWVARYGSSILEMKAPNYLPNMIVVGVPISDRNRDLFPLDERQAEPGTATLRFLDFLSGELIPYVANEYRALPHRILMGHSLAALFTLYAMLERPDAFDAYIATSPSLRGEEPLEFLLGKLRELPPGSLSDVYLYFSVGGKEPDRLQANAGAFEAALTATHGETCHHRLVVFPDEGHLPALGLHQGLQEMFPGWLPELEFFFSGTVEGMRQHYDRLTQAHGFPVNPPPSIIDSVGRRMLREEKGQEAIEAYQLYVALYPRTASAYVKLARAHLLVQEPDRAMGAVRTCLELDPENEDALALLEEVRSAEKP